MLAGGVAYLPAGGESSSPVLAASRLVLLQSPALAATATGSRSSRLRFLPPPQTRKEHSRKSELLFSGRGCRNRTHITGFGDQSPTIERTPHSSPSGLLSLLV